MALSDAAEGVICLLDFVMFTSPIKILGVESFADLDAIAVSYKAKLRQVW